MSSIVDNFHCTSFILLQNINYCTFILPINLGIRLFFPFCKLPVIFAFLVLNFSKYLYVVYFNNEKTRSQVPNKIRTYYSYKTYLFRLKKNENKM